MHNVSVKEGIDQLWEGVRVLARHSIINLSETQQFDGGSCEAHTKKLKQEAWWDFDHDLNFWW